MQSYPTGATPGKNGYPTGAVSMQPEKEVLGVSATDWVLTALWFFAFVAWIVSLSGIGALQNYCNDGSDTSFARESGLAAVSCSKLYRYQWWILFFELVTLLLVVAVVASDSVAQAKGACIGFLAVTTVLYIEETNTFLNVRDNTNGKTYHAAATAFAGFLMTTFFNLLLLYVVGVAPE